jgi:hypothetical protein
VKSASKHKLSSIKCLGSHFSGFFNQEIKPYFGLVIVLFKTTHRLNVMKNRFDELKQLVLSLEEDFSKFYEKNNKAAGTRVRKGMQDLKELGQSIRVEVQNAKNEG